MSEIVNELRRVASSAQVNQPASTTTDAAARLSQSTPSQQPQQPQNAYSSQASSYQQHSSLSQLRQSTVTQQQQQQAVKSLPRTQMPVIPAIFPELEELSYERFFLFPIANAWLSGLTAGVLCDRCGSVSQLEALATDRHALKAFVKKMHSVQEFMKLREDVMTGNVRIAEKSLSHEDEMRTLQGDVQSLRSSLREAQESLAQKQARQNRVLAVRVSMLCLCVAFFIHAVHSGLTFSSALLGCLCSVIARMRSWTSSRQRQKSSTRRRMTSRFSFPTAKWTSPSSVRSTFLNARCTMSVRSSSTRFSSTKITASPLVVGTTALGECEWASDAFVCVVAVAGEHDGRNEYIKRG